MNNEKKKNKSEFKIIYDHKELILPDDTISLVKITVDGSNWWLDGIGLKEIIINGLKEKRAKSVSI